MKTGNNGTEKETQVASFPFLKTALSCVWEEAENTEIVYKLKIVL